MKENNEEHTCQCEALTTTIPTQPSCQVLDMEQDVNPEEKLTRSQGDQDDNGCPSDEGDHDSCGYDVPTDRGWAWVICGGSFMFTFIMSMYDQVLAVMFVDIVDRFGASVTTAAVVFTVHAMSFSFGSVISSNILVPRWGVRVVIVVAAVVNSAMTIIISVSPNIIFFLAMHTIKGFSIGCMWIPALGLLGHYFRRRRSLATALTNAGMSVSLLAVPPLVRSLLDTFGFQGTLLIVSGWEMQGIAIGMLMRPVSSYTQKGSSNLGVASTDLSLSPNQDQKNVYDPLLRVDQLSRESECFDNALLKQRTDKDKVHPSYHGRDDAIPQKNGTNGHIEIIQSFSSKGDSINIINGLYCEQKYDSSSPDMNRLRNNVHAIDCGHTYLKKLSGGNEFEQNCQICSQIYHINKAGGNLQSNGIHHYQGSGDERVLHIQTNTNKHLESKEKVISTTDQNLTLKHTSVCGRFSAAVMTYFDTKLLGDWLMRFMLASTVLGALLLYIPAYIPTMAVQRGVDKTSAAMLLTVCGGVNLASLILQGWIVDCHLLTASTFIAIAQFIVGSMCHLTHFFTSFPTLVLLSVTFGMFGGARMSLIPVVAMDFVGVVNLGKALGFNAMVANISLSLHHPFLGYLLESSGTFTVPFHYVGIALYLSSILLLLEPLGRKLNSRSLHPR